MISLYVDSAVRDEVEELMAMGVFRGITTNPKVLQKAGLTPGDLPKVYSWAVDAGSKEVFFQTWGSTADDIQRRGHELLAIGERVVIKVPASPAGIQAAGRLTEEGVPVLLTAVYSAHQAVTAGALGVRYVAPYLGQITEGGASGRETVASMHRLLRATDSPTRVLAASLRTTADVSFLTEQGVDAFALPVPVARRLFQDTFTAAAMEQFDGITDSW
ncbi:transaldolase family protein [Streptomyces adonidis]|uniref:transaldolase family protein n=1 Tax=Streptomyces adonidis TaxID=3231367 RepID=UPI0034DB6B6D